MTNEFEIFEVGDSVVVVDRENDGELGTVLGIAETADGVRYLVVLENGNKMVFSAANLSYRR
jgi:hypothetical protein